jgi:hypothetical protein
MGHYAGGKLRYQAFVALKNQSAIPAKTFIPLPMNFLPID